MDKRDMVRAVYILYIISVFTGLSGLLGVAFAYYNRGNASALERSHFDYQISIFWKGLVIFLIGAVLTVVLIGYLILMFWIVWTIFKAAKGWTRFAEGVLMTESDTVVINR